MSERPAARPAEGATLRRASPGSVRRAFQPWNDPAAQPLVEFRAVTKRFVFVNEDAFEHFKSPVGWSQMAA